MTQLQVLLLVTVMALILGVVIGVILFGSRNTNVSKGDRPASTQREYLALLRVWREMAGPRLIVSVKGEEASSPEELSPAARRVLGDIIEDLKTWSGENFSAPQAGRAPMSQARDQAPTTSSGSASESNVKRLGLTEVVSNAIKSEVRKTELSSTSIAAQIDEILQEKLLATGDIHRAVRLMEIPGKGMVVMVGLNQYAGVDEVPDPDVRDLIREAVKEWEHRSEA